MNDFLRNLRSSNKKENSIPRRNIGGNYYPKEDRRQTFDRRSGHSERTDDLSGSLQTFLPQLADNSNELVQILERFINNHDLITQAKLKQMNAVSQFFENLNTLFTKEDIQHMGQNKEHKSKTSQGYVVGDKYTKEDIIGIIKSMRDQGSTFAMIAKFLTDKKIPTFSGKGEWHAQTIHRLCK